MKPANISYIIETESYIEERKNEIPKNVYEFIKEVCFVERRYIDLVEESIEKMNQQKKVFKV